MLFLVLFAFLIASSHNKPVPNNRTPITAKSRMVQSTSFVNCMATNGTSNRATTVEKMMVNLLFFMFLLFLQLII